MPHKTPPPGPSLPSIIRASTALLTILILLLPPAAHSSKAHDAHHNHHPSPDPPILPAPQEVGPQHPLTEYNREYEALLGGIPIDAALGEIPSLEKRQLTPDVNPLQNGVAELMNIEYGQLQHWVFTSEQIFSDEFHVNDELRRREEPINDDLEQGKENATLYKRQDNSRPVHITFNTCFQPVFNQSLPLEAPLPQLSIYISNSTANQAPGPAAGNRPQTVLTVAAGYASTTIMASEGVWVGVFALNLSSETQRKYSGPWNYEVAISTKEPYHQWETTRTLYLIDSDTTSALLITGNMTESPGQEEIDNILNSPVPYRLYAQNTNFTSTLRGIERSFCAITPLVASIRGLVETSITTRGVGNLPKQQFRISGLNKSSQYQVYLTKPNPDNRGGTLWEPITITTKSDGNCQIVYDLPFCSEVAYAVPANPTVFGTPALLGAFYDNIARNWYTNFTYSLDQITCNSTHDLTIQYSYARSCAECAAAYKTWLCAVTIPRCADFSSTSPYLAERGLDTEFFNATANRTIPNPTNIFKYSAGNDTFTKSSLRSRNPEIERVVRPGPYKEIKPCMDLCYSIVQSCPSSFGFTCPRDTSWEKGVSYGERSPDGDVTCSWLGAAYFLSEASGRLTGAEWVRWLVAVMVGVWVGVI